MFKKVKLPQSEKVKKFLESDRERLGPIRRMVNLWKLCPKCKLWKRTTNFNGTYTDSFYPDNHQSSGWSSHCRQCKLTPRKASNGR